MLYTVQQLSRLTGLTPRTLRYYDALGLLCPGRDAGSAAGGDRAAAGRPVL